MGATIPKCMVCQQFETEKNHIFEIHSHGKRNGQSICWKCLKKKLYDKYERRLNKKYNRRP